MLGGNRDNLAKAHGGKFRLRLGFAPGVVGLVGDEDRGFAKRAQPLGDAFVSGGQARVRVGHKQDEAGRREREIHLLLGGLDDGGGRDARRQADAARVHQEIPAAVGRHVRRDQIARDARLVMHDGNAPAREAVEEAALAHIGPADEGDATIYSWHVAGCKLQVKNTTIIRCRVA